MIAAIQITNKGDVSELTSISSYAGLSTPSVGFDFVSDSPVADHDANLIGVQLSIGITYGIDVHLAQTNTTTIHSFTWRDVKKWINNVLR